MHNTSTIRLNSEAKEKLDLIKEKHSFTTLSLAVETMCRFFEINKISPKDAIDQSYHNSIFEVEKAVKMGLNELKKQYANDSQSMRKLVRAIEKDHMINTSSKVSYIYDTLKEKAVDENVKKSIKNDSQISKKNTESESEILSLKSFIDKQNAELREIKNLQDSNNFLASKYEEKLKIIYRQYQVEKTPFGKEKIVINMTKEEFDKLFEL